METHLSKTLRAFLRLGSIIFVACLGTFGAETGTLVLEGARLIDGTGRPPIENAVLVIEGGKIRAVGRRGEVRVPKDARVDELSGKTLMPLLIDLHTHLGLTVGLEQSAANYTETNIRSQLEKFLAYGVGAVVSLGSDQDLIYDLRATQRAGNLPGARFYTAGRGFGVKGGYPPPLANAEDRNRPQTPDEAREQVRRLVPHHPDFVKMWVDDEFGSVPKMKPEICRAIIDEAHRRGLRVVAHIFYLADAKALIEAGLDGVAHSIRDREVDRTLIDEMKTHKVFYLPTLARDESTFAWVDKPQWFDDPFFRSGLLPETLETLRSPAFIAKFSANPNLAKYRAAFEMARKNLKTLLDAGVKIGFGTDSGPPLRFPGYLEHRELRLMVESGLTPLQAVVAATRTSAEILGARDLGTLEPGKQADLMELDANPLDAIQNTEQLFAIRQAGELVSLTARSEKVGSGRRRSSVE